jgi:hypothetical protein
VDAVGVIGLTVGLIIALSPPRAHLAGLRDATICRLGWVLAVVSALLLLTSTITAPPTAHVQAPTAPATSHSHPVWQPAGVGVPAGT